MNLPISLYRSEQVRELDRVAIEEHGINGFSLMERAGESAWDVLKSNWPQARNICVLCGGGNNGGDGYILARLALEENVNAGTLFINNPDSLKGDALAALEKYRAHAGSSCKKFSTGSLDDADVIVDALLGTGIDREVKGEYRTAIESINNSGKPVLAVDIPSGLNADTGNVMGSAVCAGITVTFIGLKQGMFTGRGRHLCGEIHYYDLNVPAEIYSKVIPAASRMNYTSQSGLLSMRDRDAHKGSFGHVLVVGGDFGFAGAARMAAEAAARTGAGLVSVATRPEYAAVLPLAFPEVMARGIDNVVDLNPLLDKATVIALGPGLGQSEWSSRLLAHVLDSKIPLVVDADALNLIAREPLSNNNWVLTPHPGEAARLLNTGIAAVTSDRFAAVRSLQEKYGGVIVLKGSGTLVADESPLIQLCSDGNPGMATGGMGDVLTGTIAGFMAQGIPPADAARLGVCVHAAAADRAACEGERGLIATDLMPWIRKLVNR